jgi:hypothetical protein
MTDTDVACTVDLRLSDKDDEFTEIKDDKSEENAALDEEEGNKCHQILTIIIYFRGGRRRGRRGN